VLNLSRRGVVGLILAATVLFVVGIVWEKNSGEHHSDSVAEAQEVGGESGSESGGESNTGEAEKQTKAAQRQTKAPETHAPAGETQAENGETHTGAGETHQETGETGGESGSDEQVLGVDYESTPLVILAVLASLGLAAVVWFTRASWLLLVVAGAMLGFAVFDVAEVFHQIDRDEAGIAVLAAFIAVLHLAASLGSAGLRPAALDVVVRGSREEDRRRAEVE
jgi:hypothetical protein